jgi:ribose/xylose/arabinose/galactoside ABC-type transport system permease subunit
MAEYQLWSISNNANIGDDPGIPPNCLLLILSLASSNIHSNAQLSCILEKMLVIAIGLMLSMTVQGLDLGIGHVL